MADLLNIPGLKIIEVKKHEHQYSVRVQRPERVAACPSCTATEPYAFGRKDLLVRDLPTHGRRVGIWFDRQRYRCHQCGATFFDTCPEFDEKRRMTKRLVEYIGNASMRRTFAAVADEIGLDEKTVRNVWAEWSEIAIKVYRFETPRWLGLDEVHLLKRARGVFANIEQRTIVDMTPDRSQKTVAGWLSRLPDRDRVELVCIDMWNPYRGAIQALLPSAELIIDKWHVQRLANDAMERVRKSIRQSLTPKRRRRLKDDRFVLLTRERDLRADQRIVLEAWANEFPLLGAAHKAKEAFYAIWESRSEADARAAYMAWQRGMPADLTRYFQPVITALGNWHQPIFAYFRHPPITNAYTEALNGLVKTMNRMGRGYSFDVLRAKVLLAHGAHRVVRPSFNRNAFEEAPMRMGLLTMPQTLNFGPSISTLTEMIERDEI